MVIYVMCDHFCQRGAHRNSFPTPALVLKEDEKSRGGRAAMAAFPTQAKFNNNKMGSRALHATSKPESLWKDSVQCTKWSKLDPQWGDYSVDSG